MSDDHSFDRLRAAGLDEIAPVIAGLLGEGDELRRPDPRRGAALSTARTAGLLLAAGEGRRFGGPKAPYVVDGEGIYLFLVNKEEARTPDANQTAQLNATVFPNWYSVQKAAFDITRDASITSTATH